MGKSGVHKTSTMRILNVGAGKILPLNLKDIEHYFLVNLDPMYKKGYNVEGIEDIHAKIRYSGKEIYYCSDGWKEFLLNYKYKFDKIVMYRILEHIRMTEVPFFLYALSMNLPPSGIIEGIVPDYTNLCSRILEETVGSPDFPAQNILHTTELLNEPEDPHSSIWTHDRLKYFFELEGRFEMKTIVPNFNFDGRNIYLYFEAKRVEKIE